MTGDYTDRHYLLFGKEPHDIYESLDCDGTAKYLERLGFAHGALTQARKESSEYSRYADYRQPGEHYCDFCGRLLTGVNYDVLKDRRERCAECSRTTISKQEDFEALFAQTRDGLCVKYGIDLPSPIQIKVISQAKLSKMQGSRYVPTKYFDARAVGLATQRGGRYCMYFENGTPKASLIATTAHELTHIWQYSHWDWAAMQRRYGDRFLAICEGMAKWSELQYMYLLNEKAYADRALSHEVQRTDVYGYGLRLYLKQYQMSQDILLAGDTPFMHPTEPLDIA